jgi:uncharacterized protein (TIGR00269 family)
MKYIKCGGEVFELKLTPYKRPCQYCKEKQAVIRPSGKSLFLCQQCFLAYCEKKVIEAIDKHKMFNADDKVAVMVSGGKDSATLLAMLKKLYPKQKLYAFHLNLGIGYYSDFAEEAARQLCQKLDVPLIVYNIKEKEGFSIDDFVFTNFKNKICSVCGAIKRHCFSQLATENGIDVICTAHNLDDVLSTMVSLFFNGDLLGLSRLSPVVLPLFPGQAKKVKPLYYLPEKDVFYYSAISGLPLEGCSCPHGEITEIKEWKKWIEEKEKESPSFKFRLFSIFRKQLLPMIKNNIKDEIQLLHCQNCKAFTPSKSRLCLKCRRVKLLERVKDRKLEYEPDEFLGVLAEQEDIVIFDARMKEDYEKGSVPGAIWVDKELLQKDDKTFIKAFMPYKKKKLFFMCYRGITSYRFVLRLRKFGFSAYNLARPSELLEKIKASGIAKANSIKTKT